MAGYGPVCAAINFRGLDRRLGAIARKAPRGAATGCAGRLFQRLASETGRARLPTVVRLKDGTISCSNRLPVQLPQSRSRMVTWLKLEHHPYCRVHDSLQKDGVEVGRKTASKTASAAYSRDVKLYIIADTSFAVT